MSTASPRLKRLALVASLGLGMLGIGHAPDLPEEADAQDPELDRRVQQLESALAEPRPLPEHSLKAQWRNGLRLYSSDGQIEIRPGGRLHSGRRLSR